MRFQACQAALLWSTFAVSVASIDVTWTVSPSHFFVHADEFQVVSGNLLGEVAELNGIAVTGFDGLELVGADGSPCDVDCLGLRAQQFEVAFAEPQVAIDLAFAPGAHQDLVLEFVDGDGEIVFDNAIAARDSLRMYAPDAFHLVRIRTRSAPGLVLTRVGGEPMPGFLPDFAAVDPAPIRFVEASAPPDRPLTQLDVDPRNLRYVYAIDDEGSLWFSGDAGDTWQRLPTPFDQALDFAINFDAPQEMMVVARSGVWFSADRGQTWTELLAREPEVGSVQFERFFVDAFASQTWLITLDEVLWVWEGGEAALQEVTAFDSAIAQISSFSGVLAVVLGSGSLLVSTDDARQVWEEDRRWHHAGPLQRLFPCGSRLLAQTASGLWARNRFPFDSGAPAFRVRAAPYEAASVQLQDGCRISAIATEEIAFFNGYRFADQGRYRYEGAIPVSLATHLWEQPHPGLPSFDFRAFSAVALDAQGRVLLSDMDAFANACLDDVCPVTYRVERSGFHTVQLELPPEGQEGVFGIRIDRVFGGFVAGAVLPEGGRQPAFIAMQISGCRRVDMQLFEYTGRIPSLTVEIRRIEPQQRVTVFGPIEVTPGESLATPQLCDGQFVVSIRSGEDDARGRFGIAMEDAAFSEVSFGGWIDGSEQRPFVGVSEGRVVSLDVFFGENYPGVGASRPAASIRFRDASGRRVQVSPPRFDDATEIMVEAISRALDPAGNQYSNPNLVYVALARDAGAVGIIPDRFPSQGLPQWHYCSLDEGAWCEPGGTFPDDAEITENWLSGDGDEIAYTQQRFRQNYPAGFFIQERGATPEFVPRAGGDSEGFRRVWPDRGFTRFLYDGTLPQRNRRDYAVYDRTADTWVDVPPRPGLSGTSHLTLAADGETVAWVEEDRSQQLGFRIVGWSVGSEEALRVGFVPDLLDPSSDYEVEVVSADWGLDAILVNVVEEGRFIERHRGAYLVSVRDGSVTNLATLKPEIEVPLQGVALLDDGDRVLLQATDRALVRHVSSGVLERFVTAGDDQPLELLHESPVGWLGTSSASGLRPFDSNGRDYFRLQPVLQGTAAR